MASLIEELLKQQAMSQSQPRGIVQSEVPGGLLAMLSQGNQVSTPDMSGILNAQAPQIQMPEMPTYQGGSGLGKSVISSLLGEWFDERKATKEATRADMQRKQDIAYLESIGGITDPKERAMALMQSNIKAAADAGKDIAVDQFKQPDPEKVKIVEMGVPGHPDLRQQAYYDASTRQLTPIGNPWRPSAGVIVNTGNMDAAIKDTEAGNMTDAEGNPVKIPVGMTRQEARELGYNYGRPKEQKDLTASNVATNLANELENMLFNPTNGLYNDYGPETVENKVKQTINQNWQKYAQTDPKFQSADAYIQSNLSPLIRSLGTVGALSDRDVERAIGLVPNVTGINIDTPTVAREKLNKLNRIFKATAGGKKLSEQQVTDIVNGKQTTNIPDAPVGWTDELEAEYQKAIGGAK